MEAFLIGEVVFWVTGVVLTIVRVVVPVEVFLSYKIFSCRPQCGMVRYAMIGYEAKKCGREAKNSWTKKKKGGGVANGPLPLHFF